jgi:hypothetical protein
MSDLSVGVGPVRTGDLKRIAELGVGIYREQKARVQTAVFADADTLIVVGGTKYIDVWDLTTRSVDRHKVGPTELTYAALSADGRLFAGLGMSGAIWEVAGWKIVQPLKRKGAHGLAFSPDGKALYFSGRTKVHAISTSDGADIHAWSMPKADEAAGYSFQPPAPSPDGSSIYAGASAYRLPGRIHRFVEGRRDPVATQVFESTPSLVVSPRGELVTVMPQPGLPQHRPTLLDPLTLAPTPFDLRGAPDLDAYDDAAVLARQQGLAGHAGSGVNGFITPERLLTTEFRHASYNVKGEWFYAVWSMSERRCTDVFRTMDGGPIPMGKTVVGPKGRVAIVCPDRIVLTEI